MKIVSIGINHAGTSFVRTLAKINKNNNAKMEIKAFDRNTNISFLGCGIALWVAGEFEDPSGLFYSTPEKLEKMGVDVNMEHDVIEINEKEKYIVVKNMKTDETFKETYDKLVVAAGTWPIVPKIPGAELNNIMLSKLYQHAEHIKELAQKPEIKNITVVGAGYIGVELVEAFNKFGKNVTLIDMENRIVPRYFDEEFTTPLQKKMEEEGVTLKFGERVEEFIGDENNNVKQVITNKGKYETDLVIMSIGFLPQTKMLKDKVDMLPNGAIVVNQRMQTSNKDIYAIGDAAAVHHNVFDKNMHVALATNAVKTGIVTALDIAGAGVDFPGVQGTNGINIFGFKYASTGATEATAKAMGMEAASVFHKDADKPEFMHDAEEVQIKLTYHPKTLKLIGAQVGSWGNNNHSEVIYTLSLAIEKGMTLPEIALMDVFFLPHYNKPFNFILQPIMNVLGLDYEK